jgi:hypothetical protein
MRPESGMQTLKERFEEFILSLNGVESVDRLMAQRDLPGRKSADFLALNRCVIIEQKSLDIDPHHKVPEFFEKHTNLENSVDGDLTALSHLLRRLPEGTKLGIDLYRSLTKGLDDILSYADKQTRDTRKTFFIPDAIGVVVILNDSAPTLEPDIVKAAEMLRKVTPTNELRYPENHVVILISEVHRIPSDAAVELIPTSTAFSESGGRMPLATSFAEALLRRWAEFNNALFMGDPESWEGFETRGPAKMFRVRGPKSHVTRCRHQTELRCSFCSCAHEKSP